MSQVSIVDYGSDLIKQFAEDGYLGMMNLAIMETKLHHISAAVAIQATWKGYVMRKLFVDLMYPEMSVDNHYDNVDGSARSLERNQDFNESISEFNYTIQVSH